MKNSPIIERNIQILLNMSGPSKYVAQDKLIGIQLKVVDISQKEIDVPQNICQYYNDIELSANVMCIKNILFLTLIQDNIHYGIIDAIENL